MQRVRREDTAPEQRLARLLRRRGIRHRRHPRDLPGRPDFALDRSLVAIFVDGCFWHGCPRCFHGTRRNRAWWADKIAANQRRDRRKDAALRRLGWRVMHLWEHDSDDRADLRIRRACGLIDPGRPTRRHATRRGDKRRAQPRPIKPQ
jgi:DNA mismatch endonuclease Vsr